MKKVLLLGGTYGQIYSIQTAKRLGYYTITCDYNPNNPGHKYADEYYEVSTLDKEAVLKLAKKLKIDGIICYGVDTPAVTSAYVAEKMGLPGQPLKSVEIMTNKDLFRKFLQDNGFNCPKAKGYTSSNIDDAVKDWKLFENPIMVKPSDSCGSKGISKVENKEELEDKIKYALNFSRNNRFVIEEYVEKKGYQISSNAFSVNGIMKFRSYSNVHMHNNYYVGIGNSFPYLPIIDNVYEKIDKEMQRMITLLNMKTSVYNADILIDRKNEVLLIEAGPRNGGNLLSQLIKYHLGIDLAEYAIKAAIGEDCSDIYIPKSKGYYACYVVHSMDSGILKSIEISEEINVIEKFLYVNKGAKIEPYVNSNFCLGHIILKFSSMDEMLEKMDNMDKYIKVVTEQF